MPISLKNLKDASGVESLREVVVNIGNSKLTIKYSREKYTPKFEREFRNLQDQSLPLGALSAFVEKLVQSWDVVDEIDTVENLSLPEEDRKFFDVPCNQETLSVLGSPILEKIVETIAEDNGPKKRTSQATDDF